MKVPFGPGYITLEDICSQPSAPQSKECHIQSVFQYFQNNKTKLNKCLTSMGKICTKETLRFDFKAADFHDHILFCTRYCWFVSASVYSPLKHLLFHFTQSSKHAIKFPFNEGAYYNNCYCAYVLRISRYSSFLWVVPANTGKFLRGLKLYGENKP